MKIYKQAIAGLVLVCFGFYLFYNSIPMNEINRFASGVGLGEGAVFVMWGLRELFVGLLKEEKKNE